MAYYNCGKHQKHLAENLQEKIQFNMVTKRNGAIGGVSHLSLHVVTRAAAAAALCMSNEHENSYRLAL